MLPEQSLVFKQGLDGDPASRAHRESLESGIVQNHHPLPRAQKLHHLTEIPRQRALPAERIHAIRKGCRDQFMKAAHPLDARVV